MTPADLVTRIRHLGANEKYVLTGLECVRMIESYVAAQCARAEPADGQAAAQDASDFFVNGPLVLDAVQRVATLHGRKLRLKPQEFALLELLMQRLGKPVPYKDILKHVYALEIRAEPSPHSLPQVRVLIMNVRAQLGDYSDRITPLMKFGYKLEKIGGA